MLFFSPRNNMWPIYWLLCLVLIVPLIDGADESTKSNVPLTAASATTSKVSRIFIDSLANDYLAVEKVLWSKIETQQLLVDRGQLMDEIYREHKRILEADFGQHATIWSLGLQRHAKLFNEILAINTNAQNIKGYIFDKENDKVLELVQNAHVQMEKSATEFYQLISDKSFWDNVILNVGELRGRLYAIGVSIMNVFVSGCQRSMHSEANNGQPKCQSADFRHTQRSVGTVTQKLYKHSVGLDDIESDRCR